MERLSPFTLGKILYRFRIYPLRWIVFSPTFAHENKKITNSSNHLKSTIMKKMMTLAVMMTIAISATAMTYTQARNEALFLSDKMAYELGLNAEQYAAVYEINFDYFYSVGTFADLNGVYWTRRNMDLRYVLSPWQYDVYMMASYFYRPIGWSGNHFTFYIYSRYADRYHFYMGRPHTYAHYRGGNNRHERSVYAGRTFNHTAAPHKTTTQRTFNHGIPARAGSATNPSHNGSASFNHGSSSFGSGHATTAPRTSQPTARTSGARTSGARTLSPHK